MEETVPVALRVEMHRKIKVRQVFLEYHFCILRAVRRRQVEDGNLRPFDARALEQFFTGQDHGKVVQRRGAHLFPRITTEVKMV